MDKTELCLLAEKYGTDKCVFYTPLYHELLKDRRDIKKVLEFGIGSPDDLRHSLSRIGLQPSDKMGASLYMWREYFGEAQIYALDNAVEKFVDDDRISSFYCDQGDPSSYERAIEKIGGDFDLIVEDGSHNPDHQILSMKLLMPILSQTGIYIMEDCGSHPTDSIINSISYPYDVFHFHRDEIDGVASVVVIRKQ